MEFSDAKLLVTADASLRRGEPMPMKPAVDEILGGPRSSSMSSSLTAARPAHR